MLLCNLSEPEVEEASPADCEEPPCLVTESNDSFAENKTSEVERRTELSGVDCESVPAPSDCCASLQTCGSSVVVSVRTSRRKKHSAGRDPGTSTAARKKQKIQ